MKQWLSRLHTKVVPVAFVGVFFLMVLAGVFISHQLSQLATRTNQQGQVILQLSKGLDASRQQLSSHGIKPSSPPAAQIVKNVPGVAGPTGPQGSPGAAGTPGAVGPTGAAGIPGKDGAKGDPGTPGASVTGPPGAVGSTGPEGSVGPQGAAGPVGPTGPPGADGKDGKDGTDGTNGTDGKDGANGQPPQGWTFTFSPDGGVTTITESCERVDNFDPSAPQYTCSPQTSESNPASYVRRAGDNRGGSGKQPPLLLGGLYAVAPERKYV